MAKTKQLAQEREYIINLRREIHKVPRHKRTPKAIKAIKQFIAKHMRILNRDVSKIKLDKWLNQELWFRGIRNPPTKIKVRVKRDGEFIKVELIDLPDKVKFQLAREEKAKKAAEKSKKEKAAESANQKPKEDKPTETRNKDDTKDSKKEEKEKAEAGKESAAKQAQESAKQQKHAQISKQPKSQPQRKALKK